MVDWKDELMKLQLITNSLYVTAESKNIDNIIISSFGGLKTIIDNEILSMTKIEVARFYHFSIFDCVFLDRQINSSIFTFNKFIELDIYPKYKVYVYELSNMKTKYSIETRKDFLDILNDKDLTVHDIKVILSLVFKTAFPFYYKKNVSIKNELEAVFNNKIDIYEFNDMTSDIIYNPKFNLDNTIILFDTKRNENNVSEEILIRIRDIS